MYKACNNASRYPILWMSTQLAPLCHTEILTQIYRDGQPRAGKVYIERGILYMLTLGFGKPNNII